MKTIKDFRGAGLEMVSNDIVDGITGDPTSTPLPLTSVATGEFVTLGAWTIREFAWRENTGSKPKFTGMVEWSDGLGYRGVVNMEELLWSALWNAMIKKWRPLLNQPVIALTETPEEKEELDKIFGADSAPKVSTPVQFCNDMIDGCIGIIKSERDKDYQRIVGKWGDETAEETRPSQPVFTQAMADAGELPPIGSKFIDVGLNDGELNDNEVVEAIAYDVELGRVVYKRGSTLQGSEYFGATAIECRPIDTRTDKEKAIDGAYKELVLAGCQCNFKEKLGNIYDAWSK